MNDRREDQKLPTGKTCGDCRWLARCRMLFQQRDDSTECDWSPSKFRERRADDPETKP